MFISVRALMAMIPRGREGRVIADRVHGNRRLKDIHQLSGPDGDEFPAEGARDSSRTKDSLIFRKFALVDTSTNKQISFLLKQMEKALPEIRRQVKVYEKNLKRGKVVKTSLVTTRIDNV